MSLKIWLPLNVQGTTENIKNFGVSSVKITSNVSAVYNSAGKIGDSSFVFTPGRDTQLFLTPAPFTSTTSEMSYCCWINFYNNLYDYSYPHTLFFNGSTPPDSSDSTQQPKGLGVYVEQSGNFIRTDSDVIWRVRLSPRLTINTWHHICFTYKRNDKKALYLDGELIAKANTTDNDLQVVNCEKAQIGGITTTGIRWPAKAQMNDLRIYDHALSAAEVHEIAKGLILHYKLNDLDLSGWNLLDNTKAFTRTELRTNTWARGDIIEPGLLQLTPTTSAGYARYLTHMDYKDWNNKTYTLSFDAQEIEATNEDYNVSSGPIAYVGFILASRADSSVILSSSYDRYRSNTFTLAGEGWQHYSWTFTLPSVLTTGKVDALVDGSQLVVQFGKSGSKKPLQIKNIKLELGNQDTGWSSSRNDLNIPSEIITDSSGYNYDGYISGNLVMSSDTPRYNSSLSFDNSSYIYKKNFNFRLDTWTISCWFKKTSAITSEFETICGYSRSDGADANKKFSIYIKNNQVGFVGEGNAHSSIATVDISKWHHVCVTDNQKTYKYYLDGELMGTYTNTTNLTNCTDFVVGARAAEAGAATVATPWGGNISDVRFYSTALLDTDIKQLYNVGMKIDNIQNIHTGEFIEKNNSITKFKKNAQIQSTALLERKDDNNQIQINKSQIIIPNPKGQIISSEYASIEVTKDGVSGDTSSVNLAQYLDKKIKLSYNVAADGAVMASGSSDSDAADFGVKIFANMQINITIQTPMGTQHVTQRPEIYMCSSGLKYKGPLTRITQYASLKSSTSTSGTQTATSQFTNAELQYVTNGRPAETNNATWTISDIVIEEVEETGSTTYENVEPPILSNDITHWINSNQLIEY